MSKKKYTFFWELRATFFYELQLDIKIIIIISLAQKMWEHILEMENTCMRFLQRPYRAEK